MGLRRSPTPQAHTMFGLSASEVAFWLLLAVIVIGPTNLPRAARTLRDVLAAFRRTLEDLRAGVDREVSRSLRASGLQDLDLRGGLDQYLAGNEGEFVPTPPPPEPTPEADGPGAAAVPPENQPAGANPPSGTPD